MRSFLLLPCLLLGVACQGSEATAPTDVEAPLFSAAGEHRAIISIGPGGTFLFNGQGEIAQMSCRVAQVFTNNVDNFVVQTQQCRTTNTTGQAVTFTPDNNPIGEPICAGWWDPDGNSFFLCDWFETISASGNVIFKMWGTPIYP